MTNRSKDRIYPVEQLRRIPFWLISVKKRSARETFSNERCNEAVEKAFKALTCFIIKSLTPYQSEAKPVRDNPLLAR